MSALHRNAADGGAMRPAAPRPARRRAASLATLAATIALAAGCADKGISPTSVQFNPRFSLQITITANQQTAFGPHFLIAAAGFDGIGDDEGGFLGAKVIPYTPGTHTLAVPVNLAPCLAYFAARGRQACPLLIGAAIVADTGFMTDTTGERDPFDEAFDFFFAGPFTIAAGGALPTVPPIDLSASRFGVVKWEGDEGLRLGGPESPTFTVGPMSGVPGAGAAPPVLFASTLGQTYPTTLNGFSRGPYPALAVFQNGAWKRFVATAIGTTSAPFTDVAAVSPTEAYLAHATGLYVWNGSTITKVAAVTDNVVSVGAAPAGASRLVIAGANNGAVWIGNGQTWNRSVVPQAQSLNGGVCITGPNEAFAASQASGGLFRFDGTSWASVPSSLTGGKTQLQCPAAGQAFVATVGGVRLSWTGSTWTTLTNSGFGAARTFSWAVVSPTEIYAAGDSANVDRAFYRFNGTSWQEIGRTRFANQLNEPWADPRGAGYFGSQAVGRIEKASGSTVSVVSYSPSLRDVVMTSLTSAFVVGQYSLLARWDGARWKVDPPPAGAQANRTLRGVWSDGPGNAWAVGDANTIFRFTGAGWIAFSAAAQPVAAPDNYNAVWGVGSEVWIVGDQTVLHCKGTTCGNEATGASSPLYSVWGASASAVFAVGAGGRIVRSTGSAWSAMTSPTARTLYRVAGTGPNDVWAVGDSVMLHFDGTAWTAVADDRGDLSRLIGRGFGFPGKPDNIGMWARSPKEMYFTSGYGDVGRYTGTDWQSMGPSGFRHTMMGISGLAAGCALGVTETVSDPPSPSLWRGIGPTGCLTAPMLPPLAWP